MTRQGFSERTQTFPVFEARRRLCKRQTCVSQGLFREHSWWSLYSSAKNKTIFYTIHLGGGVMSVIHLSASCFLLGSRAVHPSLGWDRKTNHSGARLSWLTAMAPVLSCAQAGPGYAPLWGQERTQVQVHIVVRQGLGEQVDCGSSQGPVRSEGGPARPGACEGSAHRLAREGWGYPGGCQLPEGRCHLEESWEWSKGGYLHWGLRHFPYPHIEPPGAPSVRSRAPQGTCPHPCPILRPTHPELSPQNTGLAPTKASRLCGGLFQLRSSSARLPSHSAGSPSGQV